METRRKMSNKKDKNIQKKASREKHGRESRNCAEPHESDRASPLSNGLICRVQS